MRSGERSITLQNCDIEQCETVTINGENFVKVSTKPNSNSSNNGKTRNSTNSSTTASAAGGQWQGGGKQSVKTTVNGNSSKAGDLTVNEAEKKVYEDDGLNFATLKEGFREIYEGFFPFRKSKRAQIIEERLKANTIVTKKKNEFKFLR